MDYDSVPTPKFPESLVTEYKCLIDGEEYPLVVGKIMKMIREGEQPRILILADPGHGKTWCAGWLAELLYKEFDVFKGSFDVTENMQWNPLEYVKAARKHRNSIIVHPDANTSFASDEYRSKGNRSNRDVIYLSRRFGNILVYDAHELAKCDKSIRTNHNIRIKSIGNADSYKWKAERVVRKNDTLKEETEVHNLGVFKSNMPSKSTRQHIEEQDSEQKERKLVEREEEWENQIEKEESKISTPG